LPIDLVSRQTERVARVLDQRALACVDPTVGHRGGDKTREKPGRRPYDEWLAVVLEWGAGEKLVNLSLRDVPSQRAHLEELSLAAVDRAIGRHDLRHSREEDASLARVGDIGRGGDAVVGRDARGSPRGGGHVFGSENAVEYPPVVAGGKLDAAVVARPHDAHTRDVIEAVDVTPVLRARHMTMCMGVCPAVAPNRADQNILT
jgi:hypothetical protein